jgi:hypothetical protein
LELGEALEQAVKQCVVEEEPITHLLRRIVEKRPENLSLLKHPTVPEVHIPKPDLTVYTDLLTCRVA